MTAIEQAVEVMTGRVQEIEREENALGSEKRQLLEAIAALRLDGRAQRPRTTRKAASTRSRATRSRSKPQRAARGENRAKLLEHLDDQPKKAPQLAALTGIKQETVASTLVAMRKQGLAKKDARGYSKVA